MTKPRDSIASQRRVVSFTMKLNTAESKFVEEIKEETGRASAEIVRGFINAFRNWFDLPMYMVAELRKQMEEKGLNERQYFAEMLAREYERTVHGVPSPLSEGSEHEHEPGPELDREERPRSAGTSAGEG